jgi:hypothetical protein
MWHDHAFMEDDLAFEHVLHHLGSIIGGLLTHPILYHGYFMYFYLIFRPCKEIKVFLYLPRIKDRKILLLLLNL